MEYKPGEIESIIQSRALNRQQYFEPTLTIFKNALVINYKKIGTRFMGMISSLPEKFDDDKKQFELYFHSEEKGGYVSDVYHTYNSFGNKEYIYTSFDMWEQDMINTPSEEVIQQTKERYIGFNKFKTTSELLKIENAKTINEFLFKNPHKDIVLILRNPLRRFISGAVQLIHHIVNDIPNNELLRDEFRFFTNLEHDNLRFLYKLLKTNPAHIKSEDISEKDANAIHNIINYIVNRRPDLTFQDIHTQNYLRFYIDFINKIEDKSRLKIISIDECRTPSAAKFFDTLRGDTIVSDNFDKLLNHRESNDFLYNIFVKKFVADSNFWNSSLRFYLESEYYNYHMLINSPYYIDLKKEGI